jgi:hypothetical protein
MAAHQFKQPGRPVQDMTTEVFGRLTVVRYVGQRHGVSHWECRCECGRDAIVQRPNLISGGARYCSRYCPLMIEDRFWTHVTKADGDGCWTWNTAKPGEYGRLGIGGSNDLAHRYSWTLHNGPIPNGLYVLHKCDNRPCVRPDHLFLGTHIDNVRDMCAKGRAYLQVNPGAVSGERSPRAVLTEAQVIEIRSRYSDRHLSAAKVAAIYGVSAGTIDFVLSGKTWKHLLTKEGA